MATEQTDKVTYSSSEESIDGGTNRTSETSGTPETNKLHTKDPETKSVGILELTPIEKNAKRDYIRISMVLPSRQYRQSADQVDTVNEEVRQTLFKTIRVWPFLAGQFEVIPVDSDGDNSESRLALVYPKHFTQEDIAALVTTDKPALRQSPPNFRVYDMFPIAFSKGFSAFPTHDPQQAVTFKPLGLRIALRSGALIFNFAFSDVIFDGQFIQNFFRKFFYSSWGINESTQRSGFKRQIPKTIDSGLETKYEFPCFDWNKSTEPEKPTPRGRLAFKILKLKAEKLFSLNSQLRDEASRLKLDDSPLIEDTIFALFWCFIIRARTEYGLLGPNDSTQANIMVPGHYSISGRKYMPEYYGNSTVTTVASCDTDDLVGPVEEWGNMERPALVDTDMAYAGAIIRKARREVNKDYMNKLYGLKQAISPKEDHMACARALRPHTESVLFEDWTEYGSPFSCRFKFIQDFEPYFFPCPDDLQEGTVIILPRKDDYLGDEDWHICVCLQKYQMETVKTLLGVERFTPEESDVSDESE
ncbi:hypothetical protein F53441_6070 [Fusarium austroafricanum]|uniref:Uncharacterized protein n=1 Tax=Fusarium austroafricanum TaxID=2364996 RepID=A0A8H4KGM0_9HYPO|nr:hypothetical protein F53441_6070 [Fusarium austroafricanum]